MSNIGRKLNIPEIERKAKLLDDLEKQERYAPDWKWQEIEAVEAEAGKWITAIMYNVDAETWDRIREAKHQLDKPNIWTKNKNTQKNAGKILKNIQIGL